MDFNWRLLNIPKRGKSLLISSEHFSETRKMCLPIAGDQAQIYTVKPQIFLSQATSISASSHKYLFVKPQTFILKSQIFLSKTTVPIFVSKASSIYLPRNFLLKQHHFSEKTKKMKNETWHNLFHKWYFKQNFSRSLDHGNCCPICKSFTAYRKSSLH